MQLPSSHPETGRFSAGIGLVVLGLGLAILGCSARDSSDGGAILEGIEPETAFYEAGARAGDLLLSWRRPPNPPSNPHGDAGEISDPFDLIWVRVEQAPRGTLFFDALRGGKRIELRVDIGTLQETSRPWLPVAEEERYFEARRHLEGENFPAADEILLSLAQEAEASPLENHRAAWFHWQRAQLWHQANEDGEAEAAFETALEVAKHPRSQVAILDSLDAFYSSRRRWAEALETARRAEEIRLEAWGEVSLQGSLGSYQVGAHLGRNSDLESSRRALERSFEVRSRLAPHSLELSQTYRSLGTAQSLSGDYKRAQLSLQEALRIAEEVRPDTKAAALALNNLGIVLFRRGNLREASNALHRSLQIKQARADTQLTSIGKGLNNLAELQLAQGDLESAEKSMLRALELKKTVCSDCSETAIAIAALAKLHRTRGDLASASALLSPFGSEGRLVQSWDPFTRYTLQLQLGAVALETGQTKEAKTYFTSSLETAREHFPGSVKETSAWGALAWADEIAGQLEVAIENYSRGLQAMNQTNLSPRESWILGLGLGRTLLRVGRWQEAHPHLIEAVQQTEDLPYPGWRQAEACYELAKFHRQRGELDSALQLLEQGLAALDNQADRLGGSHSTETSLRLKFSTLARMRVEVLLELKRREDAFEALEQSRAGVLREMLAERDLKLSKDIPEEIEDRWLEARNQYQQAQNALLSSLGSAAEQEARKSLENYRQEYEAALGAVRRASPRLAALRYQPSFPFGKILGRLDPGTALISFSLGSQESQAFLLQPGAPLKVFDLRISEANLRPQVDSLVATTLDPESFRPRAMALYRLLLAPLESSMGSAERLLILPDGPLHHLPWSALIRTRGDGQKQFLVEWKPISTAVSATLWAQLKERRQHRKGELELAAYGAPQPPNQGLLGSQGEPLPGSLQPSLLRGLDLGPLPYSRQEVESIASLYPKAQSFLGAQASEEAARRVSPTARTVHFAVHGILDSRFPLNSGLLLTLPEASESPGENGILQAWEIFEDLRLNADLVVLSACDSGLGGDAGDEGLIGLTRAFQYAGARTVAASLWKVSDQATAKLMTQFHHHLRQGKPMDQALRQAQLELLRAARSTEALDTSPPYYWAAFQLYGDWK